MRKGHGMEETSRIMERGAAMTREEQLMKSAEAKAACAEIPDTQDGYQPYPKVARTSEGLQIQLFAGDAENGVSKEYALRLLMRLHAVMRGEADADYWPVASWEEGEIELAECPKCGGEGEYDARADIVTCQTCGWNARGPKLEDKAEVSQ